MNLITYPLNNIDYTAEDAELFHCTRKSGIWAENSFMIFVNENKITIGKGIAWINNKEFSGKVAALKMSETIDMGTAPKTNPRIDVIALRFNANNNATTLSYKKGKESVSPVMPEIQRDAALYELYLCSIFRRAGATSITWNDVTDLRFNESLCGLMADSITQVDTSAINAQFSAFIERFNTQTNTEIAKLQKSIESVKDTSGIMFASDWVKNDVIPIDKGGTGAKSIADARANLGLGSVATESILPIAKGGTNANTAKSARKNLKTDARLLWTNPSPTKSFVSQAIRLRDNVDDADNGYPLYLVIFRASTSVNRDVTKIVRRDVESDVQWLENMYIPNNIKFNGRQFIINSSIADFGASFTKTISDGTDSVSEGSEKLIPVKIYGINTLEE